MTNRRETTHASPLYPARRRGCRQSGFIGKRFTQLNSQVIEQFEQRPTAFANGAPKPDPLSKLLLNILSARAHTVETSDSMDRRSRGKLE